MASIKQWHEAFQIISNDTHAEILCPECGKSFLKIDDILDNEGNIYQRGIYCPECGEKRYSLTAYGIYKEIIDDLKNSEDESVKVTEDGSHITIEIDLTKYKGGHNP